MSLDLKARRGALEHLIWDEPEAAPRWRARLGYTARLLIVLARDIASGQLTMRAMSLVYTTLLSIVPLLALSFSVLKAFGVHQQIEPTLANLLAPLGERSDEVTGRIIQFIENMNVGVLGSLGLALLFYTAVSLIQKVEESFNYIWRVQELRPLGERFSRYLSALLVGPVLVFSALGVTASVMSLSAVQALIQTEPLGVVVGIVAGLLPYLLVIGAFAFLYLFMPNTPVRLKAALAGGAVGGLLWQSAGWVFATFVAGSTRYTAIYSSFAIIILFMIWLYVSWLVLLVGAAIAFYVQHPQSLRLATVGPTISNRMREQLAVAAAALISERFRSRLPPLTRSQLAQAIRAPEHMLDPVLAAMRHARLLLCTRDQPPAWVPARDIASITLDELMHAVRAAGETRHFDGAGFVLPPQAQSAFERMEDAIADALRGNTMASLAEGPRHAARATRADVQHEATHEPAQRAPQESKPTTGHL